MKIFMLAFLQAASLKSVSQVPFLLSDREA